MDADGTIEVAYLAPVRHIPPRARAARTSFVPCRTRVPLRLVAWEESDFGPALPTGAKRMVHTRILDGALWRPAGVDAFVAGGTIETPLPSAFWAWLAGAPDPGLDRGELARCFAATPLAPRPFAANVLLRPHGPWDEGRIGRVLEDHRDRAAAAVRALFARDVALIDDMPVVRVRGPLAVRVPGTPAYRIARCPGAWTQDRVEGDGLFLRMDRIGLDPLAEGDPVPGWEPAAFADVRIRGDDDVALSVAHALHRLAWTATHGGWDDDRPEGLAQRERILSLSALASAGLIPDADLPEACAVAEAGCARLWRAVSDRPGNIERCLTHLRRYCAPVLAERTSGHESDAEAIAGLAP